MECARGLNPSFALRLLQWSMCDNCATLTVLYWRLTHLYPRKTWLDLEPVAGQTSKSCYEAAKFSEETTAAEAAGQRRRSCGAVLRLWVRALTSSALSRHRPRLSRLLVILVVGLPRRTDWRFTPMGRTDQVVACTFPDNESVTAALSTSTKHAKSHR